MQTLEMIHGDFAWIIVALFISLLSLSGLEGEMEKGEMEQMWKSKAFATSAIFCDVLVSLTPKPS